MQHADTFNYDFELSYHDNYINNLEKGLKANGGFFNLFQTAWADNRTTVVKDGLVVDNGVDIKAHVQAHYNGTVPTCMLDAMANKIGNLLGKTGSIGCELGKAIFDIVDGFTDLFGTFICTATAENLGKPCAADFLDVLKSYRDSTMTNREGLLMLKYYRDIGPKIVDSIEADKDKDLVYQYLWSDYIHKLPYLIDRDEQDIILHIYLKMIDEMCEKYGIEVSPEFEEWVSKYGM